MKFPNLEEILLSVTISRPVATMKYGEGNENVVAMVGDEESRSCGEDRGGYTLGRVRIVKVMVAMVR